MRIVAIAIEMAESPNLENRKAKLVAGISREAEVAAARAGLAHECRFSIFEFRSYRM
jgi:hypothetical protein